MVWPSGAQTFVLRYRFQNKSKKLTLGALTLAEARKKAREARLMRDEGIDPAAAKKAAKQERKVAQRQSEREAEIVPLDEIERVVETFVERHHKPKNRTWRDISQLLAKEIVGPWRGRRLSEVGKADIHDLLDAIIDRPAPILANRIFALCASSAAGPGARTDRR